MHIGCPAKEPLQVGCQTLLLLIHSFYCSLRLENGSKLHKDF